MKIIHAIISVRDRDCSLFLGKTGEWVCLLGDARFFDDRAEANDLAHFLDKNRESNVVCIYATSYGEVYLHERLLNKNSCKSLLG